MSNVISNFLKHNGKPKLLLSKQQLIARKEILDNINSGKYNYEESDCPICNLNISQPLLTTDKYGIETHIHECLNCSLVYNKWRFNKETLFDIYKNSYRKIEKPPENTSYKKLFDLEYVKGNNIYDLVCRYIKPGLVIEVGCGSGGTLKFFHEKGYNVLGYDLDDEYLNYGKTKNLNLKNGEISQSDFNEKISLIILEQCLEHIIDVNVFLKKISYVSNKDTIIYIGVPGIRNIHKGYNRNVLEYFAFFHLYHFDKNSLNLLMKNYGFTPIYIDEIIRGVFKGSGVGICNEPYKDSIRKYLSSSFNTWRFNWYLNLILRIIRYPFKKIMNLLKIS